MALTKNQKILKALVEDMLRRGAHEKVERSGEDIDIAIKILNAVIPPGRLTLIADTSRIAEAFSKKMGRNYIQLSHAGMCLGLEDIHIVRLYTGRRTPNQQATLEEVMEALKTRPDITIWHVGEW